MKTIFDTLTCADFRERPGKYLGRRDLRILQAWTDGYSAACLDTGEKNRITTSGGIPFSLFRDYVAVTEKTDSAGGLPEILLEVAGGSEQEAWNRYFVRLDEFLLLAVREVRRMIITEEMRQATPRTVLVRTADGTWCREKPHTAALLRTNVSDGWCWITEESLDERRIFCSCEGLRFMKESFADRIILSEWGTPNWEPAESSQ